MDNFHEQLVKKYPSAKDNALKLMIIFLSVAIFVLSITGIVLFGFVPLIVIGAAGLYGGYYLLGFTVTEYEYAITNNDVDIDKITGKRSRKRLVSFKLSSVTDWGEYDDNSGAGVDATVLASDNSGYNLWYVVANTERNGKVMVLFTPDSDTLETINSSVPFQLRKELPKKKAEDADEEAQEETGQEASEINE